MSVEAWFSQIWLSDYNCYYYVKCCFKIFCPIITVTVNVGRAGAASMDVIQVLAIMN